MTPHCDSRGGFALLVLLSVIGSASMAIVLAAVAMMPTLAGRARQTTESVETTVAAARVAYQRNGAFPASLTALATAAGLDSQGAWRRDPCYAAVDLGYGMSGTSLRVRSRGADLAFGTADDVTYLLPTERQLRLRQRARLRLLRALLTASSYRLAPTMNPTERASMRAAMRDLAVAQRKWLGADAATLVTLASTMATATTTVATLTTAHGCASLPAALTGAGGLASVLGSLDTEFVDGIGRPLLVHATLGCIAAGSDGVGGTNDDM